MIIYDGGFFAELDATRICTITGSLGSGKTLIAHEIAQPYLRRGYRFVGNLSSAWVDNVDSIYPDHQGQVHAFITLDEAGLYVRSAASAIALAAFARKLDTYLLFSGRKQPHRDLTELSIYLWFDFWKNFALPLWCWRWDVNVQGTKKYHGYLWQSFRYSYYGLYSTLDPADHPVKILKKITEWTENIFALYGHEYKISDLADANPRLRKGINLDIANDLASVADEFSKTSKH